VPLKACRAHLFAELEGGALDIAIVSGEFELRATLVLPLWSERIMVAITGKATRLRPMRSSMDRPQRGNGFVLSCRDPGPEIQDLLMARLAAPGDRPWVVSHDVSRENILSMVGTGHGVSLLYEASTGASYAVLFTAKRERAMAQAASGRAPIGAKTTRIRRWRVS